MQFERMLDGPAWTRDTKDDSVFSSSTSYLSCSSMFIPSEEQVLLIRRETDDFLGRDIDRVAQGSVNL